MTEVERITSELFPTHSNAAIADALAEAGYVYSVDQVRRMRMKAGVPRYRQTYQPSREQIDKWVAEYMRCGSIKGIIRRYGGHYSRISKALDAEGVERKRAGATEKRLEQEDNS